MGRAGVCVVAATLIIGACTSDTGTTPAVPIPRDAATVMTVEDDVGSWSLLERPNGCLRLQISVGDRRWLSDEGCRVLPDATMLSIAEQGVRFNDEEREFRRCPGDCGAPTPDAEMSAPVLWGAVSQHTGFVCLSVGGEAAIVRPDETGFVLSPIPGTDVLRRYPDDILTFLPDGRYIGTDPPDHPELIEQCQALGAPDADPPPATQWPFRIEVPRSLGTSEYGLFIATDTGWAPEGATLRLLADGHQIPLRLHPDTTTLTVSRELPPPRNLAAQQLPLPAKLIEILTGRTKCHPLPTVVLRLADDGDARLDLDNGAAC